MANWNNNLAKTPSARWGLFKHVVLIESFLGSRGQAPDSPSAGLAAVVRTWVDAVAVQAHVVGITTVRGRGPVVAVRTVTAHRAIAAAAGINEVVRISP